MFVVVVFIECLTDRTAWKGTYPDMKYVYNKHGPLQGSATCYATKKITNVACKKKY